MSVTQKNFDLLKAEVKASPFANKNHTTSSHQRGYWGYRLLRPFLKFKYQRFCKKNPELPWLTPDSIKALDRLLEPNFIALEYGSGRSTQFFSKRVKTLYSVEHDEAWYRQVKDQIQEKGISNTLLNLKKPDHPITPPKMTSEMEAFTSEKDFPNKDTSFTQYTAFIDSFENDFFDFILIDGRARRTCALKAKSKLKEGGLMVLDNSERKRYERVHSALKDWPSIVTTTGLTDTTIWLKPE